MYEPCLIILSFYKQWIDDFKDQMSQHLIDECWNRKASFFEMKWPHIAVG